MKRKITLIRCVVVLFVLVLIFRTLDYYGSQDSPPDFPKYEMASLETSFDIANLYENNLSQETMRDVFLQTGLGEAGIEYVRQISCDEEEFLGNLKQYQEQLFYGKDITDIVELRDGDVLVSVSQRFCYYPHGHAAIVIDAKGGQMLEAKSHKAGSCIGPISKWSKVSSFVVLRVKDEILQQFTQTGKDNPAKQAAIYATENLNGLDYSLIKEVRPFSEATPRYTQCAHLVWYAYCVSGLDIDEDRGLIVKPVDFIKSDVLEVVQVYGIEPLKILDMRNE